MSTAHTTELLKFGSKASRLNSATASFARRLKPELLVPEFVDYLPDQIVAGRLYVSIKMAALAHRCPCCCGFKVVTPITPTQWRVTFDGESISIDPSITNIGCGAHYSVNRNRILWLDSKNIRFHRLVAYIRLNIHRPEISATIAARDMGVSARYVHKLFAREGITFGGYVSDMRMDRVASLLASENTDERVVDLIRNSGYRDSSTFYRDFKRRFGCTPRSFRLNARVARSSAKTNIPGLE
jgi:AraC-like DNA-binding protein